MFAFKEWGDWAQDQTMVLVRDGVDAVFKDGRSAPGLASNPSYVVEVSTAQRVGSIGIWESGLCDILVIDIETEEPVENASMLEATDDSVPHLFKRFLLACRLTPTANGS
jgi:hypothetical protein